MGQRVSRDLEASEARAAATERETRRRQWQTEAAVAREGGGR